ncbi:MAG: TAXI family TRAP transporter solute-binding subunit [Blautia sp.]|nr:TAXI family TRAP transporter solute-binding subunit [Blautia sp.]
MKKKRNRISLMILPILLIFFASSCGNRQNIRFGSAEIGGNYYIIAQAIAGFLKEDNENLEIDVKKTAGSAANLRLLSDNYIQLGISQTDVLNDAYYGTGMFSGDNPLKGYSAIAGLYTEACQIVTRKGSGINNVMDLQGKRISVGEDESGTEQNAEQILLAYGLNDKLVEKVNLNYTDAADQLQKGRIDAFFCTAGMQTTVVEELARRTGIRLISIGTDEIRTLRDSYEYYSECTIPAGTYTGQEEDVETVAVKAVLLADDQLSEAVVKKITASLFSHASELQLAIPVDFSVTPEIAVENIPVPFHKGASAYYKEQGVIIPEE